MGTRTPIKLITTKNKNTNRRNDHGRLVDITQRRFSVPFKGLNAAPFSLRAGKKYGVTDDMCDRIASEDLQPGDLPDPGDEAAVFAFVHTFDGYAHFSSLEAAAEHAGKQPRATLDDLRNELFVAARASRFVEGADEMVVDLYRELRPIMLNRLINRPGHNIFADRR